MIQGNAFIPVSTRDRIPPEGWQGVVKVNPGRFAHCKYENGQFFNLRGLFREEWISEWHELQSDAIVCTKQDLDDLWDEAMTPFGESPFNEIEQYLESKGLKFKIIGVKAGYPDQCQESINKSTMKAVYRADSNTIHISTEMEYVTPSLKMNENKLIPCDPSCKDHWTDGRVLEYRKDYEFREVDISLQCNGSAITNVAYPIVKTPNPEEDQDQIWEDCWATYFEYIKKPSPQTWQLVMSKLKRKYTITTRKS